MNEIQSVYYPQSEIHTTLIRLQQDARIIDVPFVLCIKRILTVKFR